MFRYTVSRLFRKRPPAAIFSFARTVSTPSFFIGKQQSVIPVPDNHATLFANMFSFIKKNQAIPDALAKLSYDDINVTRLHSAIERGDYADTTFEEANVDCYLWPLSLLKENKIGYWQGITAYSYFLCLMQFTRKQILKDEDLDVNISDDVYRQFKVDSMAADGKLTRLGEKYLKSVCERFMKLQHPLDYEKLKKMVLSLPASEQWLFKATMDESQVNKNDYDTISERVIRSTPVIYYEEVKPLIYYWIPSFTFIQEILNKLSPTPMRMQPIFGSIKPATLRNLHQNHIHPMGLYAYDVGSNPKNVHGLRVGPMSQLLHDIFHVICATLLTLDERNFIFEKFIPAIEKAKQQAEKIADVDLSKRLDSAIKSIDFDLSPINIYSDRSKRLAKCLARTFEIYDSAPENQHLSIGTSADKVYSILNKIGADADGKDKKIWQDVLTLITDRKNHSHRPDLEDRVITLQNRPR